MHDTFIEVKIYVPQQPQKFITGLCYYLIVIVSQLHLETSIDII